MDENFTTEEKIAVASVLHFLLAADYRKREAEWACLGECMKEMELDTESFVPIPKNELPRKAYPLLKRMSKEKKRIFSGMMTRLSRSDAHFGAREQSFVKEILEYCEVPFVHR